MLCPWRLCPECRKRGYRLRHTPSWPTRSVTHMLWDGADQHHEVFLAVEAWHNRIVEEMWHDYNSRNTYSP